MAKLEGADRVNALLRQRWQWSRVQDNATVVVGFQTNYALIVHERLDVHHPVGSAKYLEGPFREMRSELRRIAVTAYRKTKSVAQSLLLSGLRLQREAQLRTPVLTGLLRSSAFTLLERK